MCHWFIRPTLISIQYLHTITSYCFSYIFFLIKAPLLGRSAPLLAFAFYPAILIVHTRHACFVHWSGKQAASGVVIFIIYCACRKRTTMTLYNKMHHNARAPLHKLPGCRAIVSVHEFQVSGNQPRDQRRRERQTADALIIAANAPSSLLSGRLIGLIVPTSTRIIKSHSLTSPSSINWISECIRRHRNWAICLRRPR